MSQKLTDEQILTYIQAGFSAEEISLFKHNPAYAPTKEELDALIATNDISNAIDSFPESLDEWFEEIEKTYGVLLNQRLSKDVFEERVKELAKQNPILAKQLTTLILLLDYTGN